MKLTAEDIVAEWDKDCEIGPDLGIESRVTGPRLHHKYYVRLIKIKKAMRDLNEEIEITDFKKRLYYTGQAKPEEYKEKPFNSRVLKSDLPMWLKADEDLRRLRRRKEVLEEMKEILEEIVRQINTRSFHIRNAADYQRFIMGG